MSATVRIDEEPDSLVGSVLADRYLVLELLGEGGMARVYMARHTGLDKRVAIKVLTGKAQMPNAAARFMREARAMADIDHPNVVRVTDFGETDGGLLYLVMDHVAGDDLGTALEAVQRMPWARVRHIVLQVARGLACAHAKGIVHRDVKPDNILRVAGEGDEDFVKVIDFGIAHTTSASSGRLTRTGAVFGTPEYMAPEQSRTSKVDPRVDVYALGIVAYELLTGAAPFDGDDFMEVLWKHASEPLRPPSQVIEGLEAEADAFVMRACAKDPADRFQSMAELVAALEGGLAPEPIVAIEPVARSRVWIAGVAVAAVAVLGIASFVAMHDRDAAPPSTDAVTLAHTGPEPATAEARVDPDRDDTPENPAITPEPPPEEPSPSTSSRDTSQPPAWARSKAVRAVQPGVSACVGEIMGGKAGDRVQIRFVVAGNGRVQSTRAVGGHAATALGKCVAAAAREASFPAFSAKAFTFTHTFKL